MQNEPIPGEDETAHCYAVRRVNPFRGVMQIIESEAGRALSCNGIVWEILVSAAQGTAAMGNTMANPGRDNERKTYYRFGLWSMDDGLMKRSNSPVDGQDYFELASQCDVLVDSVKQHHDSLPFTLEDNLELWLFDKDDQRPFALLSTVVPGASMPSPQPKYWSACIGPTGSPSQRRFPQSAELEEQVRQRAGFNSNSHWVRRLSDGTGVIEATGRSLPAEQFPVLLLDENWLNETEQQCALDYIRWISPSLLTLQHLDEGTRLRIESNLNVQAVSIEHHWHLYPEVIDDTLLKAARVQSRIEQSR